MTTSIETVASKVIAFVPQANEPRATRMDTARYPRLAHMLTMVDKAPPVYGSFKRVPFVRPITQTLS